MLHTCAVLLLAVSVSKARSDTPKPASAAGLPSTMAHHETLLSHEFTSLFELDSAGRYCAPVQLLDEMLSPASSKVDAQRVPAHSASARKETRTRPAITREIGAALDWPTVCSNAFRAGQATSAQRAILFGFSEYADSVCILHRSASSDLSGQQQASEQSLRRSQPNPGSEWSTDGNTVQQKEHCLLFQPGLDQETETEWRVCAASYGTTRSGLPRMLCTLTPGLHKRALAAEGRGHSQHHAKHGDYSAAFGALAAIVAAVGMVWFFGLCAKVAPCFYIHDEEDEGSTTVSDTDIEGASVLYDAVEDPGHMKPVVLGRSSSISARTAPQQPFQRSSSVISDYGDGAAKHQKSHSPTSGGLHSTDAPGNQPRSASASDAQPPNTAVYGSAASFSQHDQGSSGAMSSAIGLMAAGTPPGSSSSVLAPRTRESRASSSPSLSIVQRGGHPDVGGSSVLAQVAPDRRGSLSPYIRARAPPSTRIPEIADDKQLPSAETQPRSTTLDTSGVASSAASGGAVHPAWAGTAPTSEMLDDSNHSASVLVTPVKGGSPLANTSSRKAISTGRAASAEVKHTSPMLGPRRGAAESHTGHDGSPEQLHTTDLPALSLGSSAAAQNTVRGRAASMGTTQPPYRSGSQFADLQVYTGDTAHLPQPQEQEDAYVQHSERVVSHASSRSDVPRQQSTGSSVRAPATSESRYSEAPPTQTPSMQRARSGSRSHAHSSVVSSPISVSRRGSRGLSPPGTRQSSHRRSRSSVTSDKSAMTTVQQLVGGKTRRSSGAMEPHDSSRLTVALSQVSRRQLPEDATLGSPERRVDVELDAFTPLDPSHTKGVRVGLPKQAPAASGAASVSEIPPSHPNTVSPSHQHPAASSGGGSPVHSMPEHLSMFGAGTASVGSLGYLRLSAGAQQSGHGDPSPTAETPGAHQHTPLHTSALLSHSSQGSMGADGEFGSPGSAQGEVRLTSPPAARRISGGGIARVRTDQDAAAADMGAEGSPVPIAAVRKRRTSLSTNDLLTTERARDELMAESEAASKQ